MGSDEEEEDGDDEEDLEKGGGTEGDEGIEGKEEQMVVDVPTQDGSDQKEGDMISGAAGNDMNLCDTGKTENDHQSQKDKRKVDKSVTQQHGRSEENNKVLTKAGHENGETQLNTNQDSHTETERDAQDTSSMGNSGTANIQQVSKPENNMKIVTVTEAAQHSLNEPMEVEADETANTDTSEAVKGEDSCTGWMFSVSLFRRNIESKPGIFRANVFHRSCLNNVFVLCLRADCKVHDSVSKECCDAAADDQCGQGSADLGPGNSFSGG